MKFRNLLLGLSLCGAVSADPPKLQNPEFLQEYAETRGYLLGRPVKPKISEQGRVFFLRSSDTDRTQSLYEWKDGKARLLADPANLLQGQSETVSAEEKARNERKRQLGTGFTDFFPSPDGSQLLLPLSGKLHLLELNGQKIRTFTPKGVLDPQWSPDGRFIAYVRGHDVYRLDVNSGKEFPVTRGGTIERTHGIAEFVAQEEMRRLSGFCWSPDSRRIVFQEANHKGVEVWHISDPLHPEAPPVQQYYPRPGKANVKSRLGIVDIARPQQVRWVNLPAGSEYLASLHWKKSGPLAVQVQDRLQQKLQLLALNPDTGTFKKLVEETDPHWVPLHQEVPIFLKDGRFLYLTRNGDYQGLSVHAADGKRSHFLTEPQRYEVSEVVGLNAAQTEVLVRVDGQPGNPQIRWFSLTPGVRAAAVPDLEGVQEVALGKNGMVIGQQSMEDMPQLLWFPSDRSRPQRIEAQARNPKLNVQASFETVEADGRQYRTLVLLPQDFQPGKRYPVIVDVYGGPTKIQVAHNGRAWLMDQWLADQGFVVVAIDNRGTPGRGRKWETDVYGRFAEVPLQDQVSALQVLGRLHPELDMERVGVWGWSFGGYVAAQAVLRRPEVFKAAVAGAPVTDWSDYDTHYTERYLGTPASQPQAYSESNLTESVGKLERPLLLVHGSADDNVYYRHSLKLSEALMRAGQPYELLTLPGITHSYRADVQVTQALWQRTVQFFKTHLGEPTQKAR